MNRRQTLSLFSKGREAWNKWAREMLNAKFELEATGKWLAEETLEGLIPGNDHTTEWISKAQADFSSEENPNTFDEAVDFGEFIFPDNAWFGYATFAKIAEFRGATITRKAFFNECTFGGEAGFSEIKVEGDAWFKGATFKGHTLFDGAQFEGVAAFADTTFAGNITVFEAAKFKMAIFETASFSGRVFFDASKFIATANFKKTDFVGDAFFKDVDFEGKAEFQKAKFSALADFENARFQSEAEFDGARFQHADFVKAEFVEGAGFCNTIFSKRANFAQIRDRGGFIAAQCIFEDGVEFSKATFNEMAIFDASAFYKDTKHSTVDFEAVTFGGLVYFSDAVFSIPTRFMGATFQGLADFSRAEFHSRVSFVAVRVEHAFLIDEARFLKLPDFTQATFSEAPRIDNLLIHSPIEVETSWPKKLRALLIQFRDRLFFADRSLPSRWRALKRIAIQGHDHEREQLFFTKEMTSARFSTDWPLPLSCPKLLEPPIYWNDPPSSKKKSFFNKTLISVRNVLRHIPFVFWRRARWSGFFRFWLVLLYQLLSNFGRSVARPLAFWAAITIFAALYFLAQSPEVGTRISSAPDGTWSAFDRYIVLPFDALRRNEPCYNGDLVLDPEGQQSTRGLPESLRGNTSAATEAGHLALRNSLIVVDLGSDDALRIYGCLYGIVETSSSALPVLPANVSFVTMLQKVLSAILVFLMGLGLRNMFRMR